MRGMRTIWILISISLFTVTAAQAEWTQFIDAPSGFRMDIPADWIVTTPDGTTRYDFPDRYRRCSIKTFEAMVDLSGRFDIVDRYGDLKNELKLSNEKACWRFIPVLRKLT